MKGQPLLFRRLYKPWFVYRPAQLIRRARAAMTPPARGYRSLSTSWGVPVIADPTRPIGWSILTTGVYDLAVSEALVRLITRGDTVVDAGANVGYMTVLAAMAAGAHGSVLSFEPHPELFAVLQRNVSATRARFQISSPELHNTALGSYHGTANLLVPPGFLSNDGLSQIRADADPQTSIPVAMETLDEVLDGATAAVLKLDVEGYELEVLRGAVRALQERRIKYIVFEDHDIRRSAVVPLLHGFGYRLYALGWSMRGIVVRPVDAENLVTHYDAPSFIASIDPEDVRRRCRRRGWLVLSGRIGRHENS